VCCVKLDVWRVGLLFDSGMDNKCQAAVELGKRRRGVKEVKTVRKAAAARANLIKARAVRMSLMDKQISNSTD